MKRLGTAIACWMTVGVLYGAVELLIWAYRYWDVFLYSHRLGALTLARQLSEVLGLRPAWLVSAEHLWVPSGSSLIAFLGEGLFLYGLIALVGGVVGGLLSLPLTRLRDRLFTAAHAGAAAVLFGGVTIGLKPLQGRGDYVVAHLAGTRGDLLVALLAIAILAAITFWVARALAGRPLRRLGTAALAVWVAATLALLFSSPESAEEGSALVPAQSVAPPPVERPNVVLISIDTLRADHLSAYGYERPTSPHVDQLAADGVLFEQCISSAPWTIPAHMSLFTSMYPSEHGVRDNFSKLEPGALTLAGLYRAAGYATAGVVSALNVSSLYGFDNGFDEFDDDDRELRDARQVTDRAIEMIDARSDGPFFLFAHYFDPHTAYAPPEPYDSLFASDRPVDAPAPTFDGLLHWARHDVELSDAERNWLIGLYDGEIRYTDEQVGRLLAHLEERGLRDRTIVAVVSDHGQEFKEHGSLFHRATLYEEVLRVPCIYSAPQGPRGVRVSSTVRTIDIPPTLLELAGLAAPSQFRGQALAGLVAAGVVEPLPALAETTEHLQRKALVQDGMKLILSPYYHPTIELYRLSDRPLEQRDLTAEMPDEMQRLRAELYRLLQEANARRRSRAGQGSVELQEDQLRELKSLGYLQ